MPAMPRSIGCLTRRRIDWWQRSASSEVTPNPELFSRTGERDRPGRCPRRPAEDSARAPGSHQIVSWAGARTGQRDAGQRGRDARHCQHERRPAGERPSGNKSEPANRAGPRGRDALAGHRRRNSSGRRISQRRPARTETVSRRLHLRPAPAAGEERSNPAQVKP